MTYGMNYYYGAEQSFIFSRIYQSIFLIFQFRTDRGRNVELSAYLFVFPVIRGETGNFLCVIHCRAMTIVID